LSLEIITHTDDENRIATETITVGLPLFHAEPTIKDDTLQHTYALL